MNEMMRRLLRNKMIPAFLSVLLGIVIIIIRRAALDVLLKIIGGLIAVGGLSFVVMYFFGPHRDPSEIGMAAALLLIGLLVFFNSEALVEIFPTIMGIILILNGLSNLTEAVTDGQNRLLVLLMGVLVVAFGILIVARPGAVADAIMIYIGAFFVINGVFDLLLLHRVKQELL